MYNADTNKSRKLNRWFPLWKFVQIFIIEDPDETWEDAPDREEGEEVINVPSASASTSNDLEEEISVPLIRLTSRGRRIYCDVPFDQLVECGCGCGLVKPSDTMLSCSPLYLLDWTVYLM